MSQRMRILLFYSLVTAMLGFGIRFHITPFWFLRLSTSQQPALTPIHTDKWSPFTQESLDSSRASGRTSLVLFHADWDATSQAVRQNLAGATIRQVISRHDVLAFDADSTKENPEFEALRKALGFKGRNVVPVVAIFPGSGSPPIVLSGLNRDEMLESLRSAASE